MKKIYILTLFCFFITNFINAQNEPTLLFQKEISRDSIYTNAYHVSNGFDDDVIYVGMATNETYNGKNTAALQKLSGDSLSLEWEIIDSSEYEENITIGSGPAILKRTSDNSILWITDKNSSVVDNNIKYNLINVNPSDGTNQKLADLHFKSRSGVWEDKLITTSEINKDTDSAKTRFNILDSSGDPVSFFDLEYSFSHSISSNMNIYNDFMYSLNWLFNTTDTTFNVIVKKYNLSSNTLEWEKIIDDPNYNFTFLYTSGFSKTDNEGNLIFTYITQNSTSTIYKYSPTGEQIWSVDTKIRSDYYVRDIVISNNTNQVILVGEFTEQDEVERGFVYGINLTTGEELYNLTYNFVEDPNFHNNIHASTLLNGNKLVIVGYSNSIVVDANYEASSYVSIFSLTNPTSTEKYTSLPNSFSLNQNYPNPFNPTTIISYNLPAQSRVKLSIYNVLGEEVAQLKNTIQNAGEHRTEWNAEGLSSGIYFYNLSVISLSGGNTFSKTNKMMLIK